MLFWRQLLIMPVSFSSLLELCRALRRSSRVGGSVVLLFFVMRCVSYFLTVQYTFDSFMSLRIVLASSDYRSYILGVFWIIIIQNYVSDKYHKRYHVITQSIIYLCCPKQAEPRTSPSLLYSNSTKNKMASTSTPGQTSEYQNHPTNPRKLPHISAINHLNPELYSSKTYTRALKGIATTLKCLSQAVWMPISGWKCLPADEIQDDKNQIIKLREVTGGVRSTGLPLATRKPAKESQKANNKNEQRMTILSEKITIGMSSTKEAKKKSTKPTWFTAF